MQIWYGSFCFSPLARMETIPDATGKMSARSMDSSSLQMPCREVFLAASLVTVAPCQARRTNGQRGLAPVKGASTVECLMQALDITGYSTNFTIGHA